MLILRERFFEEKEYPYLYLDATYLKVSWSASVTSMALLACLGVDEEGFTEVLAVEVQFRAGSCRSYVEKWLEFTPIHSRFIVVGHTVCEQ